MSKPDLILVGCVKTKREGRMVASALYDSPLWKKRRAHARQVSDDLGIRWGIVSAFYGVIEPGALINSYEMTLGDLDRRKRRILSRKIEYGLRALLCADMRIGSAIEERVVEVHAGKSYVELLREVMPELTFTHPVEGMQIGEQLAWYGSEGAEVSQRDLFGGAA